MAEPLDPNRTVDETPSDPLDAGLAAAFDQPWAEEEPGQAPHQFELHPRARPRGADGGALSLALWFSPRKGTRMNRQRNHTLRQFWAVLLQALAAWPA